MANWTCYQIFLALLMLITGSINTLSTKWADLAKDNEGTPFNHPFLQAWGMFIGELSCLIVFWILLCFRRIRSRSSGLSEEISEGQPELDQSSKAITTSCSVRWFAFVPATCCDIIGTSTMYIALNLTYPSSFQMLRGAVMIFTALLSVAFLGRRIKKYMWLGMLLVVLGLALVGISDIVFHPKSGSGDINKIITGDLLIIMAQIVVAIQMVYEEKVISKLNVAPLEAVGLEGLYGVIILGALLGAFYYVPGKAPFIQGDRLEDVPAALRQMSQNKIIILAILGNIISIAFFNFSGISVTKELSATTRMVLDSCRTLVIWVFSLLIGWQPFQWSSFMVQLGGFTLLIIGMCIYNDIVFAPLLRKHGCLKTKEGEEFRNLVSNEYGINTNSIGDQPTPRVVLVAVTD